VWRSIVCGRGSLLEKAEQLQDLEKHDLKGVCMGAFVTS